MPAAPLPGVVDGMDDARNTTWRREERLSAAVEREREREREVEKRANTGSGEA